MLNSLVADRPIVNVSFSHKIIASLALSLCALGVPYFFHLKLLGTAILPMHFFVLVIALLFGWRMGLAFGLCLPIASHFLSGMPVSAILPVVAIEVGAYGFFAGFLTEKISLNIWFSLLLAMVIGRLIAGAAAYLFADLNPVYYLQNIISAGFLGIALQIVFVVPLVNLIAKWIKEK